MEHNSSNALFTVGHNFISDMTPAEKKKLTGYRKQNVNSRITLPTPNAASVNWVESGAVTAVKNQGSCGSCWAFSTTGSVEGIHQITTGELVSLSEQQLVDCATGTQWGSFGCNGGDMAGAMDYVKEFGLMSEQDYPYTMKDGKCAYDASKVVTKDAGHQGVTVNSKAAITAAIAKQPVSVAIEADKFVFQFYTQGVLDSTQCGVNLDHGVLAVGYGTENGVDYILVKNSWGSSWGENGYVKIASVDGEGICGINEDPVYPKA